LFLKSNQSKLMMALVAPLLFANLLPAQNLSIASGNGQVICPGCLSNPSLGYLPLVVLATDASGNPINGAPVTFNVTTGSTPLPSNVGQAFGLLRDSSSLTFSTTTDSTGHASTTFVLSNPSLQGSQIRSVAQAVITATSGSSTVTFYLSQGLQDPVNFSQPPISAQISGAAIGQSFSGQFGSTSSTPIQANVVDEAGLAVPNVGVFLVDFNNASSTVQCASSSSSAGTSAGVNLVLSDNTGAAKCYPTYGGAPGTGQFFINIGGAQSNNADGTITPGQPASLYLTYPAQTQFFQTGNLTGLNFTVTPGQPGTITAVSGSGQSANPGQAVAQPLVAQVLSSSGQPQQGITVNWTVSPANAATLSATTTTGPNGQTSNNVVLTGNATGTVTVTATTPGVTTPATFTITVVPVVTITSFTIVSGNNQSAMVGAAFPQPLVVQVNSSAGPASGVVVKFQVQSGAVILSAPSATTNTSGQAQVTATAGSATGSASVLASIQTASGSSTQTFSLNVLPTGGTITAANFYNGADLQPNSLSPCGLGVLIGSGPLGVNSVSSTFPGLPAPQNTATVSFSGSNAPILNIGSTALGQPSILFQVPCGVTPGSAVPVTVSLNGATSNVNLNVQAAAPGIFQWLQSDGVTRAVIVRPDGSFATTSNPARRGETEIAYVTGLGATSPSVNTTALPVPGGATAMVLGTVIPGMAGGGAPLVYAQLSPDLVGIYQVAFQVPTGAPTGDVTFSIGIIPQGGSNAAYSAITKVPVQ
jgi:uncharacterized protein (TIGR03437 family)